MIECIKTQGPNICTVDSYWVGGLQTFNPFRPLGSVFFFFSFGFLRHVPLGCISSTVAWTTMTTIECTPCIILARTTWMPSKSLRLLFFSFTYPHVASTSLKIFFPFFFFGYSYFIIRNTNLIYGLSMP